VRTEIYIEGRKADVNADIPSLITFAIDDVKNFATRSTAFSKTVVLPGTARNHALFGNIFETGHSNEYDTMFQNIGYNFNPAVAAKCVVFQDKIQTFKGTIRMLEIVRDKKNVEYEMALNGELTSLSVALSSGFLTDLDFHEHNLAWTAANITASWSATPGEGVYFPLIDYGTYSSGKKDWDFRTFRPALYVKEYIDKIFEAADFRYDCDLFSTDRFKRLIIPHNQKTLVKLSSQALTASSSTQQHIIDRDASVGTDRVAFGNIAGGLFTNVQNKTFTYIGTDPISTTLTISLAGFYNFDAIYPPSTVDYTCEIFIRKNATIYYEDPVLLTDNQGVNINFQRDYSIPITLNQNDNFEVVFLLQGGPAGEADVYIDTATLSIQTANAITSPLDYGEEIDLYYAIPQNIRQVDFMASIVKLFNLYMYESQFDDRKINIAPYIDFYDGTAVNWSGKINREVPIRIRPMSELNSKIYNFNYKDDSDYYNDLYKKRYNQTYGSHTFDSEFEFASQQSRLEIIFASTPLVGYENEAKVYPTIFKRTGDVLGQGEERIDSVIRIMQTKKVVSVPSWLIKNGDTTLATVSEYGYAGHFDDPNNPGSDLNFGVVKELFYTLRSGDLANTQFNIFWSPYMAEITSKDSKLLIARFWLTAKDIHSLDFRKYVFVDGSLYRLNKIADYNASSPADCTVELLKVINTAYTFPAGEPTQEGVWIDSDSAFVIDDNDDKILYDTPIL
jgi:hypothetical protein